MHNCTLTPFEKITCGKVEDLTKDDDVLPHLSYLVGIAEATNKYCLYDLVYGYEQVHSTSVEII
jgi:hypothetical protein